MPRANVEVKGNLDEGIRAAANLEDEIPASADDAADKIANAWRREAQRTMMKNGSVVTGSGLRSLKIRDLGFGKSGVAGASYLQFLETGTVPHVPDINNPRFITAARSYGMSRQGLAETIARKGTQPHPWMSETSNRVKQKSGNLLKIELDQAVRESVSKV